MLLNHLFLCRGQRLRLVEKSFHSRGVTVRLDQGVQCLYQVPGRRVHLRLEARVHVVRRPAAPLLPARYQLEFHHTLGAQRHLHPAVAILRRFGHENADALLQFGQHFGIVDHLVEMRRGNLLLALAHQHQIHRQFFARRLERHERAQEGVLGSLLIHGAAAHAHRAQARLFHQARLERRRTPLLRHELLHVVHEVDPDRGARTGIDLAEHSGLARGGDELHAGKAGVLRELRHVLRPLRVVAVLGRNRRQRDPVLQPLQILGVHLRDLRQYRRLVRIPCWAAASTAAGAAASAKPETVPCTNSRLLKSRT